MTSTFGGQPVLCPDNEAAADKFLASATNAYLPTGENVSTRHFKPDPPFKDWNEQLKTIKNKLDKILDHYNL